MKYRFAGLYVENAQNRQEEEFIQVITRHNGKRCVVLSNGEDRKVIPYDSLYDFCNRFPTENEARGTVKVLEKFLKDCPETW